MNNAFLKKNIQKCGGIGKMSMKKKLLVFHPIIAPYRIDFFNAISEKYETVFCLFNANLGGQTLNLTSLYNDKLNQKPEFLLKKWNFIFFKIPMGIFKRIKTFNPDIIIVSEFNWATILTLVYKFFFKRNLKVISIVDDSYDMVTNNHYFSAKHKYAIKFLSPWLDQIVNVEPRVALWFQQHYKKGLFFPIISDENLARKRLERLLPYSEEYVHRYHLNGKRVLLFVGRLVKLKNIDFAIKAFIEANVKDSEFVIVGDGPEKENLISLAKGYDNILFTGRLEGDALYAWYNVAQVFTLQSTQEAFGAVTNEALLGGCYSLVSNLAGSCCLIAEGVNGSIIDPYDFRSYVMRLRDALKKNGSIPQKLTLRPSGMQLKFRELFESLTKIF